jgi:hypothetical protein
MPTPVLSTISAVTFAAMLLSAAPAQASAIDDELPREARQLLKLLEKDGYKNVGVLKFGVKKGRDQETVWTDPLNMNLTYGVENALHAQNGAGQLTIINDAPKVIASHKEQVSLSTLDGRERLFGFKYPLAWGGASVAADAFVTGVACISPDYRQTTVKFQILDRQTKNVRDVREFTVRTERSILNDICQGFVVNAGQIRNARLDDDAVAATKPGGPPLGPEDRPVDLDVYYDNQKQPVEWHAQKVPDFQVPEPRAGQLVQFKLRNRTSARIAVVLAVNGINTLHLEDVGTEAAGCSKWVLDPGVEYTVANFHHPDNSAEPIKVLADDESLRSEEQNPHPRLGAIELFVFQPAQGPGQDQVAGLRRPLPFAKAEVKTAQDAADLARRTGQQKVRPAGLMAPSGERGQFNLTTTEIDGMQQTELRVLWYYDRKATGRP